MSDIKYYPTEDRPNSKKTILKTKLKLARYYPLTEKNSSKAKQDIFKINFTIFNHYPITKNNDPTAKKNIFKTRFKIKRYYPDPPNKASRKKNIFTLKFKINTRFKVAFVTNIWNKPYIETEYSSGNIRTNNILSQRGFSWIDYAVNTASLLFYRVFNISTSFSSIPQSLKNYKPYIIVLEYGLINFVHSYQNEDQKLNEIMTVYNKFYEYCQENNIKLLLIMHPFLSSYFNFHKSFNSSILDEDKKLIYKQYQKNYHALYHRFFNENVTTKRLCYKMDFRNGKYNQKDFYAEDGYHLSREGNIICGQAVGERLATVIAQVEKETLRTGTMLNIVPEEFKVTTSTQLLYPTEFKIAYLTNKWNKTLNIDRYYLNSFHREIYERTDKYFWARATSAKSLISNWKVFSLNNTDFNYAEVKRINEAHEGEESFVKVKSNFAKNIKSRLTKYGPHIIIIEYGFHHYNPENNEIAPKEAAQDIIESYQEIYEYCVTNGILMGLIIYKMPDLECIKNASGTIIDPIYVPNFRTFFEELSKRQENFANLRNLPYLNLEESSFSLYNYEDRDGFTLTSSGHENFGKVMANFIINKVMVKYNTNLAKTLLIQEEKKLVQNSEQPTTETFKYKNLKIAFINSTYSNKYKEPQYDYKGRRSGSITYYWPSLVASRLGKPKWKIFACNKMSLQYLLDENKEALLEFNPNIMIVETGLFDYHPQMYCNEPLTRVFDIMRYLADLHKYCIDNKIILIISTYGLLNYDYFKDMDEDNPLFSNEHKRYHTLLHEHLMDFCYSNKVFCCNIRLNDMFNPDSFTEAYLYDGVSLSRYGHMEYSSVVAENIKLAIETIDQNIQTMAEIKNEAQALEKSYSKTPSSKKVSSIVDTILKNVSSNQNFNFLEINSRTLKEGTNRIIKENSSSKYRRLLATNSNTETIEILDDEINVLNSNNNTEPIKETDKNLNSFQNIGSAFKNVKKINSNNVTHPLELLPPGAIQAYKESSKSQDKLELKIQAEEERHQAIVDSIQREEGENMEGDGQENKDNPELIVSFEICKMLDKDEEHHCKFCDIAGRCIFDQCIYDTEELPKFTRKWYTTCLICLEVFDRDPRYMKAPFCDRCISRMQTAEVLPFTCVNCGKSQNHPAIIMFSSICDYCTQHKLFNTSCLEFKMSPAGIHGVDTNHEPVY